MVPQISKNPNEIFFERTTELRKRLRNQYFSFLYLLNTASYLRKFWFVFLKITKKMNYERCDKLSRSEFFWNVSGRAKQRVKNKNFDKVNLSTLDSF